MTETSDFEIVDDSAEDQAEDAVCKEICTKADLLDELIDQFLDENPSKALAFVCYLEAAAQEFIKEDLARVFEVAQ